MKVFLQRARIQRESVKVGTEEVFNVPHVELYDGETVKCTLTDPQSIVLTVN